jgi:hypothetical protein
VRRAAPCSDCGAPRADPAIQFLPYLERLCKCSALLPGPLVRAGFAAGLGLTGCHFAAAFAEMPKQGSIRELDRQVYLAGDSSRTLGKPVVGHAG